MRRVDRFLVTVTFRTVERGNFLTITCLDLELAVADVAEDDVAEDVAVDFRFLDSGCES